jgi:hypothetical protein
VRQLTEITFSAVEEARVVVNGQVVSSPADRLRARLDDPQVAAALDDLLRHADLLATLVVGLDGMVRRSEVITDSVASAVGELREAAGPWEGADLGGLARSLGTLSGAVVGATPALNTLLTSHLTDPRAVEVISQLAAALVAGRDRVAGGEPAPSGALALLRALRDPDVARGIGFFLQVAKAFGAQLGDR